MPDNTDFLRQAEQMRDAIKAKANKAIKAADDWFAATTRMLQTAGEIEDAGDAGEQVEGAERQEAPKEHGRLKGSRPDMPWKIRDFIAKTGGKRFSTIDVRDFLVASGIDMSSVSRRTSLSTRLKEMADNKEIDRINKGAGSRPSTYKAKAKPEAGAEKAEPTTE